MAHECANAAIAIRTFVATSWMATILFIRRSDVCGMDICFGQRARHPRMAHECTNTAVVIREFVTIRGRSASSSSAVARQLFILRTAPRSLRVRRRRLSSMVNRPSSFSGQTRSSSFPDARPCYANSRLTTTRDCYRMTSIATAVVRPPWLKSQQPVGGSYSYPLNLPGPTCQALAQCLARDSKIEAACRELGYEAVIICTPEELMEV